MLLIFELSHHQGGGVQIVLLIASNVAMLLYTFLANPLATSTDRGMNLGNELFTMALCYQLMWFTDWIPDVEFKYSLGWVYIGTIGLLLLSHSHVFLGDLLFRLRLHYLRWYKRYLYEQDLRNRLTKVVTYDAFPAPEQSLFGYKLPSQEEQNIFETHTLPKVAAKRERLHKSRRAKLRY